MMTVTRQSSGGAMPQYGGIELLKVSKGECWDEWAEANIQWVRERDVTRMGVDSPSNGVGRFVEERFAAMKYYNNPMGRAPEL